MDLIQFAIFAIVISVVTWAILKYATTLPQWAKTTLIIVYAIGMVLGFMSFMGVLGWLNGMLHYRPNIGG